MDAPNAYRDELLVEIIAEKLGFGALSDALPGPEIPGSYLLVTIGLFIEYGVFDVYNYLIAGKSSFLTQPNALAIPAMAIIGVVGLRYIHEGYANAMVKLGIDDDETPIDPATRSRFEGLLPLRFRVGGYLLALCIYYAFIVFGIGISELVEISGLGLVLYAQLVSFPLIIIPVLSELALSYIAVHFLIPRRIAHADFGLFYYDPRNLGGFEPIGQLLKRSYYVYTAILLLWFFQTHAPVVMEEFGSSPYPPPGTVVQIALTSLWIVGVLTIAHSMYRIHSIMKNKKEEKVHALVQELKATVEDPFDVTLSNIQDQERYENVQKMLSHVENTKTYPTTFTMWSQILISVLLPQALSMAVEVP